MRNDKLREFDRLIADQQSNLTDEELFLGEPFKQYAETTIEGTSGIAGKNFIVRLFDLGTTSFVARAVGLDYIDINISNAMVSGLNRKRKFRFLIGLIIHECGHRRYTDFSILEKIAKQIVYKKTLKGAPYMTGRLAKMNQAGRITIAKLFSRLQNYLEDGFIEIVMIYEFPGFGRYLEELRTYQHESFTPLELMRANGASESAVVYDMLLCYSKYGTYNVLDEEACKDDSAYKFIKENAEIIDKARTDRDMENRCVYAAMLLDSFFKYFEDLSKEKQKEEKRKERQQQKEQEQSDDSSEDFDDGDGGSGDSSSDDAGDDSSESSEDGSGNSSSEKDSDSSGDSSGEGESGEDKESGSDSSAGNGKSENRPDKDDSENGSSEENGDDDGSSSSDRDSSDKGSSDKDKSEDGETDEENPSADGSSDSGKSDKEQSQNGKNASGSSGKSSEVQKGNEQSSDGNNSSGDGEDTSDVSEENSEAQSDAGDGSDSCDGDFDMESLADELNRSYDGDSSEDEDSSEEADGTDEDGSTASGRNSGESSEADEDGSSADGSSEDTENMSEEETSDDGSGEGFGDDFDEDFGDEDFDDLTDDELEGLSSDALEGSQETESGDGKDANKSEPTGSDTNGNIPIKPNSRNDMFEDDADDSLLESLEHATAQKRAESSAEARLEAELQKELDKFPRGDFHRNINASITRASSDECARFQEYYGIAKSLARRLAGEFRKQIDEMREGSWDRGLYSGKRMTQTYRHDKRVFANHKAPEDVPKLRVEVNIDKSGSTRANRIVFDKDRNAMVEVPDTATIDYARITAMVLYLFCKEMDVEISIHGHSATFGYGLVDIVSYAEPESCDGRDIYRIANMEAGGCNRDGFPVRFWSEHLLKTCNDDTILFINISDGCPNDAGYGFNFVPQDRRPSSYDIMDSGRAKEDITDILTTYGRKGICFITAGVSDDQAKLEGLWCEGLSAKTAARFLDMSAPEQLPRTLVAIIKKFIML